MTTTQARTKVQNKFNILDTTFDTLIDDCVADALTLLAPFTSGIGSATTASNASSVTSFASALQPVAVLIKGASQSDYYLWKDWTWFNGTLYLTESVGETYSITIITDVPFTTTTIASITDPFLPGLIDFAYAEFAATLAGSKSHYNVYAQMQGARSVDNMLDLSTFYENRAQRRLSRVADSEGLL